MMRPCFDTMVKGSTAMSLNDSMALDYIPLLSRSIKSKRSPFMLLVVHTSQLNVYPMLMALCDSKSNTNLFQFRHKGKGSFPFGS